MDESYPIILISDVDKKKGTLKELTLLELSRETIRLFREECKLNDVEYWVNEIQIEDDNDLETEFEAINGSDNEDENEDSDDDAEEEKKDFKFMFIRLEFKLKKIKICVPKPIKVGINNIQSTTVIFDWILDTNTLNENQLSALSFEIQQIFPKMDKINSLITKCNPITNNNERYEIKLSGLHPETHYKFSIVSILKHENKNIYSELCDIIDFETQSFIKSHNIPHEIEGPTDLQVIALYSDSVILSWNHNNPNILSKYDYEYYIYEQDVFGNEIIAATEDNHFIRIKHLSPLTQYTFICKSKYYDPERLLSDMYYQHTQIISTSTNSVTIITPQNKINIYDYKTRTINKVRWRWIEKQNQLELFWVAPESFYGRIEYEIMDKIQGKIIGNCCKLPVIITTDNKNKSIFEKQNGKYIITVKPILINDDEKEEQIYCEPYDIEITIDDEKNNYSSQSMLEFSIKYITSTENNNMQRTIRIDTANCDFNNFKKKILFQFKINNKKRLKISIQIPYGTNTELETMDINNNNSWRTFINNHSQKFLSQHKQVYCFIQTIINIPQNICIVINSLQFEIDFKSQKTEKYYCQIEAKKDNTGIDSGRNYNQITSTSKPLIFNVPQQHKYYYFRFKIKCSFNGEYSQWTKWKTIITSQNQQSPLQSSPLQSSPLQSSPLQSSPLQQSPLQQSPLQQSPLQFDFPKKQQNIDKSKTDHIDNSGSLEDLTSTYAATNNSDFWKNF